MSKIDEAVGILKSMGLPQAQQNERSALTLLSLLSLKEDSAWSSAKKSKLRIHDIIIYIQKFYSKPYAENSRESIRRQTLHQFMHAGIVEINPDDSKRSTNSPKTVYALTDEAFNLVKKFGTPSWKNSLNDFINTVGKLVDKYDRKREKNKVSLELPEGSHLSFSPGKHNELQVKVITKLKVTFFPDSQLVYVGDAARKLLYKNEELATSLRIPITKHDKLPDVVYYNKDKNQLFLIEAVTSHGPITHKRKIELEEALKKCKAKRVYISAFPDFKQFKKHIDDIAWDTEIWIAVHPQHMVHFNGPQFFTAYD